MILNSAELTIRNTIRRLERMKKSVEWILRNPKEK